MGKVQNIGGGGGGGGGPRGGGKVELKRSIL